MVFLSIEIRISIANIKRVNIINIRIEMPDTWSVNTHIISQTQCLCHTHLIRQSQRRNHIKEVCFYNRVVSTNKIHILLSLLCT